MDNQGIVAPAPWLFGRVRRHNSTLRTVVAILTALAVILALFAQLSPSTAWAASENSEDAGAVEELAGTTQEEAGNGANGEPENGGPGDVNEEDGNASEDDNQEEAASGQEEEPGDEPKENEPGDSPDDLSFDIQSAAFGGPGGFLTICKEDPHGELLGGAEFQVKRRNSQLKKKVKVNDGCETLFLEKGKYQVTEITAPKGFQLNRQTRNVEIKKNSQVQITFVNKPKDPPHNKKGKGKITVCKKDEETKEAVSGATFILSRVDGKKINGKREIEFTIKAKKGCKTLEGLHVGKYEVVEKSPPEGYLLNDTPQTVWLLWTGNGYNNPKLTFYNVPDDSGTEPDPTKVTIVKVDARDPELRLNGACFRIDVWDPEAGPEGDWKEFDTVCIEEDGEVTVELPDGYYRVTETKAPNGYRRDRDSQFINVYLQTCLLTDENGDNGDNGIAAVAVIDPSDDDCMMVFENTKRTGGGGGGTPGTSTTETTVEEQDDPGAGIIEVVEEVAEEEAPAAGPDLPRTGGSTALYYVPGLAFLAAGIWLRRRQRPAA